MMCRYNVKLKEDGLFGHEIIIDMTSNDELFFKNWKDGFVQYYCPDRHNTMTFYLKDYKECSFNRIMDLYDDEREENLEPIEIEPLDLNKNIYDQILQVHYDTILLKNTLNSILKEINKMKEDI